MAEIHLKPSETLSIHLDSSEHWSNPFTSVEISNEPTSPDAPVTVWLRESDAIDVRFMHEDLPQLTVSFANDECVIVRDKDSGRDLVVIYANGTIEVLS